ncbi:MAG: DUF1801 domain-containing protein [Bacteroidota bacterium]
MHAHPDLQKFLAPYSPEIQALTMDLRNFLTALIPEANELIWDNYNAVAMAYSKSEKLSDAFCHIAVYAKHVNFGFNRGAELSKQTVKLAGKGKLIRHVQVRKMETFPQDAIKEMIWEALGIAESLNPALMDKKDPGKSMVMSVSEKKIRPS